MSVHVFSAAQVLLNDHRNIIGILQAAMRLYDPVALLQLQVVAYPFDHVGDTAQE